MDLGLLEAERRISGRNVLVTGAGGFIGSNLVERLVQAGAKVRALVRYNALSSWGNLEFLPREVLSEVEVVSGNVEDGDYVMSVVQGQDIVLHLAALIAIPYSYAAPRSYVRANVEGTLNVLEAARRHSIQRVVHTSTSEVYGTALRVPIDEEHPLQGQSPYSASKIGADKMAESYWRSFGTQVVTLRPFNTYGPRQSARAFIPTVISQALTAQPEIRMGALDPERDMTFVADTASGFILAALVDDVAGETINLGTGHTASIGTIAGRILSLMQCDKPLVHEEARMRPKLSEVMRLVSDNSKAKRLMGWEPRVKLDDGLLETISFIRRHSHLYRPSTYTV
jgi:NAD dependent epimerase/dehydratase